MTIANEAVTAEARSFDNTFQKTFAPTRRDAFDVIARLQWLAPNDEAERRVVTACLVGLRAPSQDGGEARDQRHHRIVPRLLMT